VFSEISLELPEGGLHLVVGATGSGKSTLLGLCNGHVPHFTGGLLEGTVTVGGISIQHARPRDFAEFVGMVRQNPRSSFVADTVAHELIYAMENLGWSRAAMRRRLDEVLEELHLTDLANRPLNQLSGGQAQRVAIGAALAAKPRLLILDEPTSGLDIDAAHEVLNLLAQGVSSQGLTVIVSEHRLERVIGLADTVVVVDQGCVTSGTPTEMMAVSPVVPPIVELGRQRGLSPLPLTVAEARPHRDALVAQLQDVSVPVARATRDEVIAEISKVTISYLGRSALSEVTARFHPGEVLALVGPNGAGKSTLLGLLSGLAVPTTGTVTVGGDAPTALDPTQLVKRVGLIPQDPGLLLYSTSVARECSEADRDAGRPNGTTASWFERFQPSVDRDRHPSDLSEGQRLCLALAVIMATAPPMVLLDEPTCGLDNAAKDHLGAVLMDLAREGTCVVVATHDVEFMAEIAGRIIVLSEGKLLADGPAREVVVSGHAPSPEIFQLTAPEPWLTTSEILLSLARNS
ncbi:MAG: ATP-binding cassette domain-containing protein, partial [Actinomycetes bacterium]